MFLGGDSIRMLEYLHDVTGLKSEINNLRAQVEMLKEENDSLRADLKTLVDYAVEQVNEGVRTAKAIQKDVKADPILQRLSNDLLTRVGKFVKEPRSKEI